MRREPSRSLKERDDVKMEKDVVRIQGVRDGL